YYPDLYARYTPHTYTQPLPLHDALPISTSAVGPRASPTGGRRATRRRAGSLRITPLADHRVEAYPSIGPAAGGTATRAAGQRPRSEEHTSELQSRGHLVCRLLLEKKKTK